jgi:hypothetical protein
MILIHFADAAAERRALGALAGRFSFTTWKSGETAVPEAALAFLALEGIPFQVQGPATYGKVVPALRDSSASTVQ